MPTQNTSSRLLEYLILAVIFVCITTIRTTSNLHVYNHQQAAASLAPFPSRVLYSASYNQTSSSDARPTTFLLGIFTTMQDVQRRRLIRETMLGPDLPINVRERLCSLQDYVQPNNNRTRSCQVIYTFVVGGSKHAKTEYDDFSNKPMTLDPSHMLKHEHDILYLNIRENMNDGKTPTWFTYAARYLVDDRIDYVSKADSDTLISIPELLCMVQHDLPARSITGPKVYGGYLNEFDSCGGGGEICDKLRGKVYMSGQFFWLSYDLVLHVSSPIIRNTNFYYTHNEDLDMGFRVLSYPEPLHMIVCNGAQFWKHMLKDDSEWLREFEDSFKNNWYGVKHENWWNGLYDDRQQQIVRQAQFTPDVVID